ncbi:MAG: hypothetical protein GWO24_25795, partial [Akkermansiaceae bacterium]|nr:hypothetical protein [Akkermansiaceae bacterium]
MQQNARWTCGWSADSPPRLRSVRLSDYERVGSSLRFVDATGALAGGAKSIREQMTIGAGHWVDRIQKFYAIDSIAQQGIAIGDA